MSSKLGIFLNDRRWLSDHSDMIVVSSDLLNIDKNTFIFDFKDGNGNTKYVHYVCNPDHPSESGFKDSDEKDAFVFLYNEVASKVDKWNRNLNEIKDRDNDPLVKEFLNQSTGPKWIVCCYPFICVCRYIQPSHRFLMPSNFNIERNPDAYKDLISACKQYYDLDDKLLDLKTEDKLIKLDNSFNRSKDVPPYLSTYENRCLWCGKKLTGRIRHYCNDTTCKKKDFDFTNVFKERLQSADPGYTLTSYKRYVFYNGMCGKPIDIDEIHALTIDDLIQDYENGLIPHQIIMSWIRGLCRECGKEIPLNMRTDAEYCCPECSSKGRKKKSYHKKKDSTKND